VELSSVQVRHVVQAAARGRGVSRDLLWVVGMREVFAASPEILEDGRLSSSLLTGLLLLASCPPDGSYTSIVELSRSTGMAQSTVYRYVYTLAAVGLLERDTRTRKYRLPR
jgi:DNA-binding MarR family transcriptional regulator